MPLVVKSPLSLLTWNSLSLSFSTLTLLKRTGQFFFVEFFNLDLSDVSSQLTSGYAVLISIEVLLCGVISGGICMSGCLTPGDADLHHIVKVVFARFPGKATIFLLVKNKYLVGRNFETMLTFSSILFH